MPTHSSSTSSSDGAPILSALSETGRSGFATAAFALLFLIAIDVALNLLFPYPTDPRAGDPGFLPNYFEYGRSVEGTLQRMTGPSEEASDPIVSVSSHEFASPSDPGNYLPDSHFHAEHDDRFARELVARIDGALAARP